MKFILQNQINPPLISAENKSLILLFHYWQWIQFLHKNRLSPLSLFFLIYHYHMYYFQDKLNIFLAYRYLLSMSQWPYIEIPITIVIHVCNKPAPRNGVFFFFFFPGTYALMFIYGISLMSLTLFRIKTLSLFDPPPSPAKKLAPSSSLSYLCLALFVDPSKIFFFIFSFSLSLCISLLYFFFIFRPGHPSYIQP